MPNVPRKPKLTLSTRWKAPDNPIARRAYGVLVLVNSAALGLLIIIGTVSVGFGLAGPWLETLTLYTGATAAASLGLGYLLKRLTVDYNKLRRGGFFLLPLLLLLSGCMTYEKAVKKWGHLAKDSVIVEKVVAVQVPKDSVTWAIDNATLQEWLGIDKALGRPGAVNDPGFYTYDTSGVRYPAIDFFAQNGRARLHVSRPAQRAGQKPAPIQFRAVCDTVTVYQTVRVASPPRVTFQPNHDGWKAFAAIGWIVALVLFLLVWLDRRTRKGSMPEYTPPIMFPDGRQRPEKETNLPGHRTPPPPPAPPADRVIREGRDPMADNS